MQTRQFDLSSLKTNNRPSFRRTNYQGPSRWKKRLGLYLVAAVALGALWLWQSGQRNQINDSVAQAQEDIDQSDESYLEYLANSPLSATELAQKGIELLEAGNPRQASLVLQTASQKDPKYRDAAVYAGFAELTRADLVWETNPDQAVRHTKRAIRYLDIATVIDPIHGYTYELLGLAHENLGETQEAEAAKAKAVAFNLPG